MIVLKFSDFGWWNHSSIEKLRACKKDGDKPGWCGVTDPPMRSSDLPQSPYFVSGATNAEEAIAAGMPADAAKNGEFTTPSKLLDGD